MTQNQNSVVLHMFKCHTCMKVEVSRDDEDYDAKVVAVSTDSDAALITVE